MSRLLGRERMLDQLGDLMRRGATVLLLGPFGIGKSAVLEEVGRRLRETGTPCALAPTTRCLHDVGAALAAAYPEAAGPSLDQRKLRSRLRLAVEARPGALLLDHVVAAGTAMRAYLRSFRGMGLGMLLAADVENERDRAAARALHLSSVEVVLPPLPRSMMIAALDGYLEGLRLPHALRADDRDTLVELGRGNPGRLRLLATLIAEERFWRDGRVCAVALNEALLDLVMRHYLVSEVGPEPRRSRH